MNAVCDSESRIRSVKSHMITFRSAEGKLLSPIPSRSCGTSGYYVHFNLCTVHLSQAFVAFFNTMICYFMRCVGDDGVVGKRFIHFHSVQSLECAALLSTRILEECRWMSNLATVLHLKMFRFLYRIVKLLKFCEKCHLF